MSAFKTPNKFTPPSGPKGAGGGGTREAGSKTADTLKMELKAAKAKIPSVFFGRPLAIGGEKSKSEFDYFEICVVDPNGNSAQVTVHRPIGIHHLAENSWVITETRDLEGGLRRLEDCDRQHWLRLSEKKVLGRYILEGKLLDVDGVAHYKVVGADGSVSASPQSRKETLDAYKKQVEEAKKAWKDECRTKNPGVFDGDRPVDAKPDWKGAKYPPLKNSPKYPFQAIETKIQNDFREDADRSTSFVTTMGTRGEIEQKAAFMAPTRSKAFDFVLKTILAKGTYAGEQTPMHPSSAVAGGGGDGGEKITAVD